MRKILTCLISFLILNTSFSQVTIENLLSVPFPTELKRAPNGKYVAWVFNNQGARNVYVAASPLFNPRKLTAHYKDDGIDISNVSFTANGKYLLFTEGNPNNMAGEPANPALSTIKTEKFIYTVQVDGTGLRKIGAGDKALPSPNSNECVFLSRGKVWIGTLSDTTIPIQQLFETRGAVADIRWSPDGRMLAFISNRGDHSFLGLYKFEDKSIDYPDPSVDVDAEPVWSPDGKWLAYVRKPRIKNHFLFSEMRKGLPWSIRLLNMETLETKELWKASEGSGSILFSQFPVAENLLLWSADNQLIFPWEKDGWQHLYAIDVFAGKQPRLLTPGAGEVEFMELSEDKKNIIYSTNIGDSHRRHIWNVSIAGGQTVQLSKGEGIEWSPMPVENGIMVLRSTAVEPGWPTLLKDGQLKKIATDLFPVRFPADSLVVPELVSFTATDGMKIFGELFLPSGYVKGKKYPALLFFHGGSKRQMLLGFHYMGYYSNDYAMNQYYAHNGYIVLAVNYRSGIGYGMEFREALHYGTNGCSEYNDVLGAGQYIKSRKDVNPKQIGLWGGSYGGYLTAMGLARNSDLFACGVDIHGVYDWNEETKIWFPTYEPTAHPEFALKAFNSSPSHYISGWRSPVLLIHGDDDRNVPFSQSVDLMEALRKRNVKVEQLIIPDEVHDFLMHKTWVKGYYRAAAFFKINLRDN